MSYWLHLEERSTRVSEANDGPARVEQALRRTIGDHGAQWLHRRSKHLANLTPYEVAQHRGGDRIVLAELDKIALQARGTGV
jgi:hypothetical protein